MKSHGRRSEVRLRSGGNRARESSPLERDSHPVASLPDDPAREFQPVVPHDQCESSFDRNGADRLREFDRRAGGGKVAHRARVFITAVFRYGRFVDLVSCGNSGFDHLQ